MNTEPKSFTSAEIAMRPEDFLPSGALHHCTEAIQDAAANGVRELERSESLGSLETAGKKKPGTRPG